MNAAVHVHRTAWRALVHHGADVGRSKGVEAIGWLVGFFVGDEPYALDAVPATRYKHQSRYGAVADPREEAELALAYPRDVGIVGLYHSHPFRDETSHAIFHSATDDATLRSRASRRENYLSVVTDGRAAECFVLGGGTPVAVEPDVREDLSVRERLSRLSASVSAEVRADVSRGDLPTVVAELERRVSTEVDRAVRGASVSGDRVRFEGLSGGPARNRIAVEPADGRLRVTLSLHLEPSVFVSGRDEAEVLRAMRNEVLDDVVFLLWRGFDAGSASLDGVARFEANLGSLRVQDTNPLPRKLYRPPKRGTVVRRSR